MLRRTFELDRFLQAVSGTETLGEYCQARGVAFEQRSGSEWNAHEQKRWQEAIAQLSPQAQADIELELFQVSELAHREAIYHLLDVCAGRGMPSDLVAGE